MNIIKKIYYRSYQFILKCVVPFMPIRFPKILNNELELIKVLKDNNKNNTFIVVSGTLKKTGILNEFENKLKQENINYTFFSDVSFNPTIEEVECALKIFNSLKCDSIIAIGGGSKLDLAKIVGARSVCPNKSVSKMKGLLKIRKEIPLLIAVPTTSGSGSETTVAAVISDHKNNTKYAITDYSLMPKYALLNYKYTISLSPYTTATTGMDALTHAIEAYIGKSLYKSSKEASLKAIKLIYNNLLLAYNEPTNVEARKNMLLGSYYAGSAITKSYVGYVHALSHALGGKYNVSHGETNAIILPVMLKKYGKSVYKKLSFLAVLLDISDEKKTNEENALLFIKSIEDLNSKLNIPSTIKVIEDEDINSLALHSYKEANPFYPVPRIFTINELKDILKEIKNGPNNINI